MAMTNELNYQTDDANKFNSNYRSGKVYLNTNRTGVFLKLDLIYVRDSNVTENPGGIYFGLEYLSGNFSWVIARGSLSV